MHPPRDYRLPQGYFENVFGHPWYWIFCVYEPGEWRDGVLGLYQGFSALLTGVVEIVSGALEGVFVQIYWV